MAKKKNKKGLPPGSVIYTGDKKSSAIKMHRMIFDINSIKCDDYVSPNEELFSFGDTKGVVWIDVRGVHDVDTINLIGEKFKVHNLILEDIVNIYQRPKYEELEEGIFITLKFIKWDEKKLSIGTEQISIYFNEKILLSFQEDEDDTFENIRIRIEKSKGRIRSKGTDYLAYAIMDSVVDDYFETLEKIGDVIEKYENQLIQNEDLNLKTQIYNIRRELMKIRSYTTPLREINGKFSKSESQILNESTLPYLRDLQDHVSQVAETLEVQRDLINGLYDLLVNNASNKMNKVMKTLTIISTIFIPLTFLAGIYGMNFDYMPELRWKYGYFGLLSAMAVTSFIMVGYFKRKKWF